MKLWRSLSFRLALLYAALFVSSVGVLMAAQWLISIARPTWAVETQVMHEQRTYSDIYILDGRAALLAALRRRAVSIGERKAFHGLFAADGSVIDTNLPTWPKSIRPSWLRIEADIYQDGEEDDHYALALDRRFADGARLIVGRDIEDLEERGEALGIAAIYIFCLTLGLSLAGGALMSRAIGRRVDAINTTARRVISGDLSGRVSLRGSNDDFDRLGETLNLMLARIEDLLVSVRRVSDSIAHELRTPLARLQADLEDLAAATDGPERDALLAETIDEALRLQSVFDALLRITRIESGRHVAGIRTLDLSALLSDAVELYAISAEEKSIALSTEIAPGLRLRGDPDLLFQAVSNLLDNAIKYTPPGGHVAVSAAAQGHTTRLSIVDDGPGIPAHDHKAVFERFYRVEATAQAAGVGLGLTLVAAIATLHGSSLVLSDAKPGLRIDWEFGTR